MALIRDTFLVARTKDESDAGTDNQLTVTVNNDGVDVFDANYDLGGGRGEAQLYEQLVLEPFDTSGLTNSSIRLGIRGDNVWKPQHILLIARTEFGDPGGRTFALALETDLTDHLSSDSNEGHLTMPLRLAGVGNVTTVIRRVLFVVYTSGGNDVQTDSDIQLQIVAASRLVLSQKITDNLEQNRAHLYFFDVDTPFTTGEFDPNAVTLRILGENAWLPGAVFLFGLDTGTGRPNEMVALVSMREWDLGWLSTDTQEGHPFVSLPLAPRD